MHQLPPRPTRTAPSRPTVPKLDPDDPEYQRYELAGMKVVNNTLKPLLNDFGDLLYNQVEGEHAIQSLNAQLKNVWTQSFLSHFDQQVARGNQGDLGRASRSLAASLRKIVEPRQGSIDSDDLDRLKHLINQIEDSLRTT